MTSLKFRCETDNQQQLTGKYEGTINGGSSFKILDLTLAEVVTFRKDLFWTHATPDLVTGRVAGDRVPPKSMIA